MISFDSELQIDINDELARHMPSQKNYGMWGGVRFVK